MSKIRGKGPTRPPTSQRAPSTEAPVPKRAAKQQQAKEARAAQFEAEAGRLRAAPEAAEDAALPRSGWTDQVALRKAATKAAEALDHAEVAGQIHFRSPGRFADATDPPLPPVRPMYGLPMPLPVEEIDVPVVPMYGVPVPRPADLRVHLKDKGLKKTFEGMMADGRLSLAEARRLIRSSKDGGGLSKTERKDFERLIEKLGPFIDADALAALNAYLGRHEPPVDPVDPPVRPMYGVPVPGPEIHDPPVRPLYGVGVPGGGERPPIRALYGVAMPRENDPS